MPGALIDLVAIEASLYALVEAESACGARLTCGGCEPMTPDGARRMLEGYAYVNCLLRDGVELFRYGASMHWLELNHVVLCGSTPATRAQYRDHMAETERWFYEQIGSRIEWGAITRSRDPVWWAAHVFLHITSSPQLFIEGNTRTATLIASYILASGGSAPLVMTPENRADFCRISDACAELSRGGARTLYAYPRLWLQLVRFLRTRSDTGFLLAATP
ncbi:hypothetical protein ACRC7T_09195 [Segnochrobactraceae bacterium EtOH-i3]